MMLLPRSVPDLRRAQGPAEPAQILRGTVERGASGHRSRSSVRARFFVSESPSHAGEAAAVDAQGYTIVHKRLERGRCTFPDRVGAATTGVEIDAHELSMLLEGLERKPGRSARRGGEPASSRRGRADEIGEIVLGGALTGIVGMVL